MCKKVPETNLKKKKVRTAKHCDTADKAKDLNRRHLLPYKHLTQHTPSDRQKQAHMRSHTQARGRAHTHTPPFQSDSCCFCLYERVWVTSGQCAGSLSLCSSAVFSPLFFSPPHGHGFRARTEKKGKRKGRAEGGGKEKKSPFQINDSSGRWGGTVERSI